MHLVRRGQKVRAYRRISQRKSRYKRKKRKKTGIGVYVRNTINREKGANNKERPTPLVMFG